jgi:hypothetical protein
MRKKIDRPSEQSNAQPMDLSLLLKAKLAKQGVEPQEAAPAIRNGIKTERDTQPVQVRMLKAQLGVLKQVATQEGRTASDVIRDLVDAYIACCLNNWKEGPQLDILRASVRAEGYYAARHASAEKAVADASGTPLDVQVNTRHFEHKLFKKGVFASKL